MFVQLRKSKNDSGIILIIVLVILLVMATISIGIFSQSLSQSKTAGSQVDEIVAEQLAKGIFFSSYNNIDVEIPNPPSSSTQTIPLNGKSFYVNTVVSGSNTSIVVTY